MAKEEIRNREAVGTAGGEMSEGHCGNCDHYHYLMQRKVDCIVDGELHDTGNSCDDYKKRVTGKS